jgi:hypothetical protein
MDNREAAFAAYPVAIPRTETRIMQNSSLVQQDAATMDGPRIWDFLWMEVIKSGLAKHLLWGVPKNFKYGIRGVEYVGIRM